MSPETSKPPPAEPRSEGISPKAFKAVSVLLFLLVFLSLGLNWYLISQLLRIRQQALGLAQEVKPIVQDTLSQAATDLETFQNSTIEFEVQFNEEFPVHADIPFNETIEVPIQATVPIRQQIETSILLDPFQSGFQIPVDVVVPVDMEIPIDMVVPIAIDRTVSISTTVPINLDIPIAIAVSETDLAGYIEQVRDSLTSFEVFIDQAMSNIEQ